MTTTIPTPLLPATSRSHDRRSDCCCAAPRPPHLLWQSERWGCRRQTGGGEGGRGSGAGGGSHVHRGGGWSLPRAPRVGVRVGSAAVAAPLRHPQSRWGADGAAPVAARKARGPSVGRPRQRPRVEEVERKAARGAREVECGVGRGAPALWTPPPREARAVDKGAPPPRTCQTTEGLPPPGGAGERRWRGGW